MALQNDILLRATELGKLLAQTEEVAEYKEAEKKLLQHPVAKEKMDQLKAVGENEQALNKALSELESIEEVQNFQKAQEHVQALLQTVSQIVADSVLNA